ncbi:PTS sugar transporter subunit IIA [Pseudoroseomonas wenyumeiae]|uniref:PTS sugar transporter subunit IIA n=1 Tax=Teichococcus wenyumeiae TaxID=2478470 RepID=A0A3A9JB71_9PROT|nr:PTS sugar transporter subunit IIA [Pseudoroseomonas wenyumeiae]RKK02751.1 PTS sugar transporter subunit IIA [Pseudoroseomonas wenyumeiae]RMI25222.1 PTS sugar transporter subunit IIA [Pseudoroseomonas wenyumeiae]
MIGMVLVSHGRLADELRLAMEHVVGPQRGVATVCIGPEDDMEGRRQDIRDCVAAVDQGDGVVILTDMFGGTPSNLATAVAEEPSLAGGPIEVIAGINLPLMVKLARVRGAQPLAEAVEHAMSAGRRYISCATPSRCTPPEPMVLCGADGKAGTS